MFYALKPGNIIAEKPPVVYKQAAVSDFGRVLSVIPGVYGIVVVALITSVMVSFCGGMKAPPETDSGGAAGENEPAQNA